MLLVEVDPMTEETRSRRREYQRQWEKDHPEKIQEYRRNARRRAALSDLLSRGDSDKLIEILRARTAEDPPEA